MSSVILRGGRRVADYHDPYIVAELNTSHFGDMDMARAMIDRAREVGCDCVKFQSWSTDSLYAKDHYAANPVARRMVAKFSLGEAQLAELSQYCAQTGIDFASTPYSLREARFLVDDCKVPFLKVASMELDNLRYLEELARLGVPLVISTGMGTLPEIVRAVAVVREAGAAQVVLLHCTSVYPAAPETVRLHNILGLRTEFPDCPIGYSDHTEGLACPVAAVALGACLVERHFTLDRSRIGMDNQMATEPPEMAAMVAACRTAQRALGGSGRMLCEQEQAQRPKMRRSLVTARALRAGEILCVQDLDAKRPGTGIAAHAMDSVLGKRVKVDLEADVLLQPGHVEDV